jgi:hypothetical protein
MLGLVPAIIPWFKFAAPPDDEKVYRLPVLAWKATW